MKLIRNREMMVVSATLLTALAMAQRIELQSAQFDPFVRGPLLTESLKTPTLLDHTLWIVQFSAIPTLNDREALQDRGASVLDYLPQNALLVRASRKALTGLAGVRWIGAYDPGLRLSPEIGLRPIQDPVRRLERTNGVFRVAIYLTRDAQAEFTQVLLENLGLDVYHAGDNGDQAAFLAKGTREQIENAARNDAVQFVEEVGERTYRNNTSRWIVQSNVSGSTPLYTAGITGTGQIIGILDGQVWMGHTSFSDTVPIGPSHRKVVFYGVPLASDSHGTHVAGTAAGDAGVFDDRRGVAYGAKIAFNTDPSTTAETDLYNRFVTHHNNGARVHSNSWGDDGTTAYNGWARAVDNFSYNFEDSLVVFAITNITGVMRTPENAKSALAVGATQDNPNQASAATTFSGTGPTADGRRKPEVMAPGQGIISSSSSSATGTVALSGTSMATPAVSGSAALIRQFLVDGRIHNGNPNGAYSVSPSGALLRSMLATSAVDMSGVSGYPSTREGFGRILVDNVLALPGETRRTIVQDVRNSVGLSTGQSSTFRFRVVLASQPLRVTIAYTDFPGAVNAAAPVVNNLNLSLFTPTAQTFLGNVFNTTSGGSMVGGTADPINTLEMVNIASPAVGEYTVTVTGAAVPSGTRQGFGLVVNGAVVRSQVTGTLSFGNWLGPRPSSIPVTFVNSSGVPFGGGAVSATVNTSTGAFSVEAPPNVTGAFRLRLDWGAFLRRQFPSTATTDLFANLGTVTLTNGDPDRNGEVDAADIDLVVANFGASSVPATSGDINGDGEVDAADIDVVILRFGSIADY